MLKWAAEMLDWHTLLVQVERHTLQCAMADMAAQVGTEAAGTHFAAANLPGNYSVD
jgi:hypothetical protein